MRNTGDFDRRDVLASYFTALHASTAHAAAASAVAAANVAANAAAAGGGAGGSGGKAAAAAAAAARSAGGAGDNIQLPFQEDIDAVYKYAFLLSHRTK